MDMINIRPGQDRCYRVKKRVVTAILATAMLLPLTIATVTTTALASEKESSSDQEESRYEEDSKYVLSIIRSSGRAVTGSNRYFSEPIWDLGEALGDSGFNFVFGYNPGQSEPVDITAATSTNTVMATGLDDNYLALFGMSSADIDPALVNVPIHQVSVLAGPSGELATLPSVSDVGATVRSRIESNVPVTLENWLKARGEAKFKCYSDGTSSVKIKLKGLIPDSIYSAWGVFSFDSDGDGLGDRVGGVPLGGVPNILIASEEGKATFSRPLNFCPDVEQRLKYLTIAFHSNTQNYGSVPDQAVFGFPGGTFAHAAVSFPINVVPAQQP